MWVANSVTTLTTLQENFTSASHGGANPSTQFCAGNFFKLWRGPNYATGHKWLTHEQVKQLLCWFTETLFMVSLPLSPAVFLPSHSRMAKQGCDTWSSAEDTCGSGPYGKGAWKSHCSPPHELRCTRNISSEIWSPIKIWLSQKRKGSEETDNPTLSFSSLKYLKE